MTHGNSIGNGALINVSKVSAEEFAEIRARQVQKQVERDARREQFMAE